MTTCKSPAAAAAAEPLKKTDVEHRLVFKMSSPKLMLFEVCRESEFDLTTVRAIAQTLLEKRRACNDCVDDVFTYIWSYRLCKMGTAAAKRAWDQLCDILAVLRVTSTQVERKHLIGQELKAKKRGSGVSCAQVAKQVFRYSVKRAGQSFRDEAKHRCLGFGNKAITRSFHRCLDDCLADGRPDRRAKPDSSSGKRRRASHVLKTAVPIRGYDIFVGQSFDRTRDGEHTFVKRRKVDLAWRELNDAQRAVFNAAAAQRNDQAAEYAQEDYPEFFKRQAQFVQSKGAKRNCAFTSARLRAVQTTVNKMVHNAIYDAEPRLHEFDSGFRTELVCKDVPMAEVMAVLGHIFRYKHVPEVNPRDLSFFETCAQRYGGLCVKSEGFDYAETLTRNMYANIKEWKNNLPLLLQFSTGTASDQELWVWVGKLVGSGSRLAMFTPAVLSPNPLSDSGQVAEVMVQAGNLIKSKTSHFAFSDFLLNWQRDQGPAGDYKSLEMLHMTRHNFRRDPHAAKFRVIVESTHSVRSLSCTEVIAVSVSKPRKSADDEVSGMFSLKGPAKSESSMMTIHKKTQICSIVREAAS